MPHAYPILLDLSGAKIVIVGGGKVAARKAQGVIDAGATNITVVAPELAGGFAPTIKVLRQPYTPDVLQDATLVFAATDRADVNTKVVEEARARGILVNRADADAEPPGDFVTPAKFVDGEVVMSVSAGSAALAVVIRDGLREKFDPRWSAMAAAMLKLRPTVRARVDLSTAHRAALFRRLATPAAFDVLQSAGIEGLLAWIEAEIIAGV